MFWNVFVELCIAHNTSPNAIAADLKLSSGSVTAWKNGATPRSTTLKKIADYFSVSTDYLLGEDTDSGIKKEPPQTGEARRSLHEVVDSLTEEQCQKLLGIVLEAKNIIT